MDKKWKKKIETFLISSVHCTKCKMRNEKEKLFRRYLQERLQCLPVTLNLYFHSFFPDYKALFNAYRAPCRLEMKIVKASGKIVASFVRDPSTTTNDRL
jgi:hypothetical protein